MSEEWGPWVEHDGKSCPKGQVVKAVFRYRNGKKELRGPFVAGGQGGNSWFWGEPSKPATWSTSRNGLLAIPVVSYQIKKPKGLSLLEEILAEVKDTATPKESVPKVKQGA